MVRRLSLACVIVLCASSVSAQTVAHQIDLSEIGLTIAYMVETDGNPATEEWLGVLEQEHPGGIRAGVASTTLWRVIAIRPYGLCFGDWFDPYAYGGPRIVRKNGRDVIHAVSFGVLTEITLKTPACD